MTSRVALLGVTLALALAGSGTAAAATVSGGQTLRYAAAPGEANAVTITYAEGGASATVADPGATLTAGGGCTLVDAHAATCTLAGADELRSHVARVNVGDLADTVTMTADSVSLVADGGTGDDTLTGPRNSFTDTRLDGGPGADHLIARDVFATLVEGDPDRDPQPDVLDAGHGEAIVSYAGRTTSVSVDLGARVGGAEGEQDTLNGVTGAIGGAGADELIAGPRTTALRAGGGDDLLVNAGAEEVVLAGGRGQDGYDCELGDRETVYGPEHGEFIPEECNFIAQAAKRSAQGEWRLRPRPRLTQDGRFEFRVRCPASLVEGIAQLPCAPRLTLTDPGTGRAIGRARTVAQRDGGARVLRVRPSKRALGLLRRNKPVDVTLTARGFSTVRWTLSP